MQGFVATKTGLFVVKVIDGAWGVERQTLNGRFITCVSARNNVILAGTRDGLLRSDDGGQSWVDASEGLKQRHIRWISWHPTLPQRALLGTEPAAIYISEDGGHRWQARPEVADLRDELGWWLPYSPEAGCVRGFAYHGERAYAAVEVGGALRSDNGGLTWRLVGGSDGRPRFGRPQAGQVHPDVHSIAVHLTSADLVYAPTGGGFYRSRDGGDTWEALYSNCYVRAVWVNPHDQLQMVLGPAENSSGRDGRIEVTDDGGQTWRVVTERWANNMVERFTPAGDTLLAVMANGSLLATPRANPSGWRSILSVVSGANAVETIGT